MLFLDESVWEVRETKEKGKGLFTKKSLPAGEIIGDYTGTIIHPRDADLYESGGHFYLMYYHDYASIFPDLSKPDLYLLNHSCTPNCWMYTYKGHTLFFTLRHIFPGEELTISYLLSPQDRYDEPCNHRCLCESEFCTSSMHLSETQFLDWQKAYNEIVKKTRKARVSAGQELTPLPIYPQSIPDHPVYTLFGNSKERAVVMETAMFPSKKTLRQTIRETGRSLAFPSIGVTVLGVNNDEVVLKPPKPQ